MAGPGRKSGIFLPAQKFSVGPGRKSGHFSARAEVFGGFGQEIGHFSARAAFFGRSGQKTGAFSAHAGGMDGFFGGREFCWERGRFLLGGRGLLGEWCFAGRGTRTVGGSCVLQGEWEIVLQGERGVFRYFKSWSSASCLRRSGQLVKGMAWMPMVWAAATFAGLSSINMQSAGCSE